MKRVLDFIALYVLLVLLSGLYYSFFMVSNSYDPMRREGGCKDALTAVDVLFPVKPMACSLLKIWNTGMSDD